MTIDPAEPREAPPMSSRPDREERREPVVIDASAIPDPTTDDLAAASAAHVATEDPIVEPSEMLDAPPPARSRKGLLAGAVVLIAALGGGGFAAWKTGQINPLLAKAGLPLLPAGWASSDAPPAPSVTAERTSAPAAANKAPETAAKPDAPKSADSQSKETAASQASNAPKNPAPAAPTTEKTAPAAQVAKPADAPPAVAADPGKPAPTAVEPEKSAPAAPIVSTRPANEAPAAAASTPPASSPTPAIDAGAMVALEGRINQRLGAIEAAVRDRPAPVAAPAVDLKPLSDRLAALDKRMTGIETQLAAPKTDVRAAEAPEATAPKKPDPAALAVVAQSISRAIERGAPFARELAAAQALGASPDSLAPLKAIAATGAPTARALGATFEGVRKATFDAADQPLPSDASITDRLSSMASKLVRAQPAKITSDDAPNMLLSSVDSDLARGDVASALAAWNALPLKAKDVSRAFGDAATARVNAEKAASALTDKAIDDIAKAGTKP
jgi:hypothetical protein